MKRTPLFLAAAAAVTVSVFAQDRAPQNDSIRQADLKADLYYYASNAMRGRLTATGENQIATEFIKGRFERLGLQPVGGQSFFHTFDVVSATLGPTNTMEVSAGTGATLRPVSGQDFVTQRFSASASARGQVVFTNFGIVWPEKQRDDFPADQVRGKIVVILGHEPGERDTNSPFNGLVTSEYSVAWRKALAAQQRGAIGILFVEDVHNHADAAPMGALQRAAWPDNPSPRGRAWTLAAWLNQITIPIVQVSRPLATQILQPAGRSLEELAKAAEQSSTPVAVPGVEVQLTTSVNRPITQIRNVVARLEGSDPQLRNEAVLITAHLDHEGVEDGAIYAGADDNGSGTVGMLEVAEAYALAARNGRRPRRSVVFVSLNAEERGLLGAWAYTEQPPFPLDKTVGVINLDMIGRNEEIPPNGGARFFGLEVTPASANTNSVDLYGYSFAPDLAAAIERANRSGGVGLELKKRNDNNASNLVRRSDQWPFLHRGVAAIGFHTGLHPDYHTPADTPDKINYEKIEKVARLAHQVTWDLANQNAEGTTSR
ncbi:MAG: M28 family peptidase [Vicinamibacterales bacterium]